jgi:hypothetical protein
VVTTEVSADARESLSFYRDTSFLQRGSGCDPGVFLASIDPRQWIPRILSIYQGQSIVGFICAKERKVLGLRSGLISGDDTLSRMVAAEPGMEGEVFEAGVRHFLSSSRTHGLRLVLPPDGHALNAIQRIAEHAPVDVQYRQAQYHTALPLGDSYDSFLHGLGDKTRRNFRYYRRRFESVHRSYVPQMELHEFGQVALQLEKLDVVGANLNGIKRGMRMMSQVQRPMLTGLRGPDGEWLSILGGWYEGDQAVVFLQMNNDQGYPQDSLCTVARGYLIESLIAMGIRKLVFWAGVGGPIARYCAPVPTVGVFLDKRTLPWRATRRIAALSTSILPRKVSRELASWVTPIQSSS